jgi:asparagine synthase (glutamine-hydrolysing)
MCGFIIIKANKIDNNLKKTFLSSLKFLKHRGPDKTSYKIIKNTLIGFNRLSINNILTGDQPLTSACGKYIVVFNGEIINYKTLSKKIKKYSNTEVETILDYYLLYKEKCVDYFRGFFSLVIFDTQKQSIFAAVDKMNIKPLYYSYSSLDKKLILTSDYSHLSKFKINKLDINIEALRDFICLGRSLGGSTIYSNIFELQGGQTLNYEPKKGLKIKNYWKPFKKIIKEDISLKKYSKRFKELFFKINDLWKIAETKISLTLSSGVDSNLINLAFKNNDISLKKFHIIESKDHIDDKNLIKEKINYQLILNELIKFTKKNKNPFVLANSGSASLFQLYKKINKSKIKVSFTGEGADEIFGGYERYIRQNYLLDTKKMNFDSHLIKLYQREINLFLNSQKFEKENSTLINLKRRIKSVKLISKENKNKILEFDQLTWLPMLLRKHDTIGMNYSIEVRPPFLDEEIVEFANNLNSKFKFDNKNGKLILKEILFKYFKKNFYDKKKLGTKSLISTIFNDKKKLDYMKKSILNSKFVNKFFKVSYLKRNEVFSIENSIFLWRLFILSIMFKSHKQ